MIQQHLNAGTNPACLLVCQGEWTQDLLGLNQPIVIRLCVFVQTWEGLLLFAGACRDLSLFLNDSCAAGHLASVVSPVSGRGEGACEMITGLDLQLKRRFRF